MALDPPPPLSSPPLILPLALRDSVHGMIRQLCAKQSVVADTAVPKSLSDLLSRTGDSKGHNSRPSLRAMGLPHNYEAKEVYPWRT